MTRTYAVTVPGTLYGVDEYAVLKDPASGAQRRIKEGSVALVIASGPPPGDDTDVDSTLCLVHARVGTAPDLGWISNEELTLLQDPE